jgi:hypothetical protein
LDGLDAERRRTQQSVTMNRSSSFWFGWPKEEVSATEHARQAARREKRLDQHMLQAHDESTGTPGSGMTPPRSPVRMEQRDPQELKRGVDVQELSESAYGRLFSTGEFTEEVDD